MTDQSLPGGRAVEEVASLLVWLSSAKLREQHPPRAADCVAALAEQLVWDCIDLDWVDEEAAILRKAAALQGRPPPHTPARPSPPGNAAVGQVGFKASDAERCFEDLLVERKFGQKFLAEVAGKALDCLQRDTHVALLHLGCLKGLLEVTECGLMEGMLALLDGVEDSTWSLLGLPIGASRGPVLSELVSGICTLAARDKVRPPRLGGQISA